MSNNDLNDAKLDIHNGNGRNIAARRRLAAAAFPARDKKAIADFISCISAAEALSSVREAKLIDLLRKARLDIGKDYGKLKRPDLEAWLLKLNKSGLSPDTQGDYRKGIKRFIRWHQEKMGRFKSNGVKGACPELVSWIHEPKKEFNRNGVCREVLLEESEVLKIIQAANSSKWRAFFWLLWEAGLRPGELLNLHIRDVESTEAGIRINVRHGKTGARKLPLVQARQAVLAWLDIHEQKEDPAALLFPISYIRALQAAEEFSQKAGIKGKRTGLKFWRKSRATFLARFMSQAQLQFWFGWSSPKTSVAYVYASEKDLLPVIMEINNLAQQDRHGSIVEFRLCARCGERNLADKVMCLKCAFPLTAEGMKKLQAETLDQQRQMVQQQINESMAQFLPAVAALPHKQLSGLAKSDPKELAQKLAIALGYKVSA